MVPRKAAPHSLFAVALGCIAGLAGVMGACTRVPLVAPSGTVMSLLSTTNVLPVNGSTDIIAILIRNGTATTTSTGTPGTTPPATPAASNASTGTPVHDGTVVDFTTTLGHLEPTETTTSAGSATVKLVADGRSGVATVTAYSGGASKTVTVNIGAAAAARIVMTAQPQALPASGGNSTVTANVQDQQGNPISGVPVSFSVTAGTASLSVPSAVTDPYGNATTMVSATSSGASGTTTGSVTITGTAGGGTGATGSAAPTAGTVTITFAPHETISITPVGSTITVSTPMAFTVTPGANGIVTDVTVDFGDGGTTDLGALSAAQTVGYIYGSVRSFTATATATFADGFTTSQSVPIVVGPYSISVTASPTSTGESVPVLFSTALLPATVSIPTYSWDFGDGNSRTCGCATISHAYVDQGLYTVQVTANPQKGPQESNLTQVNVTITPTLPTSQRSGFRQ